MKRSSKLPLSKGSDQDQKVTQKVGIHRKTLWLPAETRAQKGTSSQIWTLERLETSLNNSVLWNRMKISRHKSLCALQIKISQYLTKISRTFLMRASRISCQLKVTEIRPTSCRFRLIKTQKSSATNQNLAKRTLFQKRLVNAQFLQMISFWRCLCRIFLFRNHLLKRIRRILKLLFRAKEWQTPENN